MTGTVYLIHFDENISHARHYLGWTGDLESRLESHASGRGAKLMAEVSRREIPWRCVRTWPNVDRHFERKLKRRKNGPKLCPACNGGAHT